MHSASFEFHNCRLALVALVASHCMLLAPTRNLCPTTVGGDLARAGITMTKPLPLPGSPCMHPTLCHPPPPRPQLTTALTAALHTPTPLECLAGHMQVGHTFSAIYVQSSWPRHTLPVPKVAFSSREKHSSNKLPAAGSTRSF